MTTGSKKMTLSSAFANVIPMGSNFSPSFLNNTAQTAQVAVEPNAQNKPISAPDISILTSFSIHSSTQNIRKNEQSHISRIIFLTDTEPDFLFLRDFVFSIF